MYDQITRGWMGLAGICLAGLADPACAEVFKCSQPDGKVAYQSEPCAAGDRSATLNVPAATAVDFGPMMAGWNESEVAELKATCTSKTLADFRASWQQHQRRGEFPEAEYRDSSIAPFCECIARRASASYTRAAYEASSHSINAAFVKDATGGGACKPVGRWGRELEQSRR